MTHDNSENEPRLDYTGPKFHSKPVCIPNPVHRQIATACQYLSDDKSAMQIICNYAKYIWFMVFMFMVMHCTVENTAKGLVPISSLQPALM